MSTLVYRIEKVVFSQIRYLTSKNVYFRLLLSTFHIQHPFLLLTKSRILRGASGHEGQRALRQDRAAPLGARIRPSGAGPSVLRRAPPAPARGVAGRRDPLASAPLRTGKTQEIRRIMAIERTLSIIKPDATAVPGATGEILSRFEKAGLRILAMKKHPPHRDPGPRLLRGPQGAPLLRRAGEIHDLGPGRRERAGGRRRDPGPSRPSGSDRTRPRPPRERSGATSAPTSSATPLTDRTPRKPRRSRSPTSSQRPRSSPPSRRSRTRTRLRPSLFE